MYVSIPHYLKHQFCKGQSRKMVISLLSEKVIIVFWKRPNLFISFFFAKKIYTLISNNANSTKYIKVLLCMER